MHVPEHAFSVLNTPNIYRVQHPKIQLVYEGLQYRRYTNPPIPPLPTFLRRLPTQLTKPIPQGHLLNIR